MPASTTENAVALAFVVILNWMLSHLANNWTMPPEVQSSLQAIIVAGLGAWLKWRHLDQIASGDRPPDAPQVTPESPKSPTAATSSPAGVGAASAGTIPPLVKPRKDAP